MPIMHGLHAISGMRLHHVARAVRHLCLIRHPHALLRRAGGPRTILRRRPPLPMSLGRGLAVVGRPCRCGEAEGRNEGDRKRLHGHHEYPLTEWRGIAGSDATLPRAEQTRSLNQPRFMGGSGSGAKFLRSEEHTSELQSLMRSSYAVFCLKKKKKR